MEFRCLSVKQPWAGLISLGIKTIETRTWETKYRVPLLIISSMKPDIDAVDVCVSNGFIPNPVPDCVIHGGITVAMVDVLDCVPMTEEHVLAACCDVYPRANAWILGNIRPTQHLRVKGGLSIFKRDITESLLGI